MRPEDFDPFAEMLQSVSEHVTSGRKHEPLTPSQVKFYWNGLSHYDLDAIRAALGLHIRNPDVGQFMPKIADVVRGIEGSMADSAARAWTKVLEGMRRAGQHQSVTFDDPAVNVVLLEMGGWPPVVARMTEKEEPFVRREFEMRYRGLMQRGGPSGSPTHLPGIAEASNVATGRDVDPPVFIGDRERCRLIADGAAPMIGAPA